MDVRQMQTWQDGSLRQHVDAHIAAYRDWQTERQIDDRLAGLVLAIESAVIRAERHTRQLTVDGCEPDLDRARR
jgi:capsule polysaccharide export protein KpsE/RkpR